MAMTATTKRESEERRQTAAFGRAVYQLRIKASISQEELAFRSGIGRSYISVLERGGKEPCLGVMFRLSRALKSSLQDIFALTEQHYKEADRPSARNPRVR